MSWGMLSLTVIIDWKLDFYLKLGSTAISHLEDNLKEQFQAPKFYFFLAKIVRKMFLRIGHDRSKIGFILVFIFQVLN